MDPGGFYGDGSAFLAPECLILTDQERGLFTFPRHRTTMTVGPAMNPPNAPLRLAITNPAIGEARIHLFAPDGGDRRLDVYNVCGRLVRSLGIVSSGEGASFVRWDGRDEQGRLASPGVYFVHATGRLEEATGRVVFVR